MNNQTRKKALRSLDGMAEIVGKEMLVKGAYVNDEIDPTLKAQGAICGGHKYCAIGSLWAGAGIRPKLVVSYYWGGEKDGGKDITYDLPGTTGRENREDFLASRPGLRTAYDALNEAAEDFILAHEIPEHQIDRTHFDAAIEALFEGAYADSEWEDEAEEGETGIGSPELLSIIEDAKRLVLAAA